MEDQLIGDANRHSEHVQETKGYRTHLFDYQAELATWFHRSVTPDQAIAHAVFDYTTLSDNFKKRAPTE